MDHLGLLAGDERRPETVRGVLRAASIRHERPDILSGLHRVDAENDVPIVHGASLPAVPSIHSLSPRQDAGPVQPKLLHLEPRVDDGDGDRDHRGKRRTWGDRLLGRRHGGDRGILSPEAGLHLFHRDGPLNGHQGHDSAAVRPRPAYSTLWLWRPRSAPDQTERSPAGVNRQAGRRQCQGRADQGRVRERDARSDLLHGRARGLPISPEHMDRNL